MTSRLQVKDEQKNHLHIYDLQFWCVLHFVLILVKIWLMVKVSGVLITNLNHPLIWPLTSGRGTLKNKDMQEIGVSFCGEDTFVTIFFHAMGKIRFRRLFENN